MGTCCWLHDSTCCAYQGQVVPNIGDLEQALGDLVEFGLSRECYIALANLECAICGGEQRSFLTRTGEIEQGNQDLDNQVFTFRICPSLCDSVVSSCTNNDALLIGANPYSSDTAFCESISGRALVYDKDEISGVYVNARFVVSDSNCFSGVDSDEIEAQVGVCLAPYNNWFVPGFKNTTIPNGVQSSASILSLNILASLFVVAFAALF